MPRQRLFLASFVLASTMLISGLILGVASPATAVEYPMGSISGVVTPESAHVSPDEFEVSFGLEDGTYDFDPDPTVNSDNLSSVPDTNGNYSASLQAGRYVVYVRPVTSEAEAEYPPMYYPAVGTSFLASWVTVVEGENTVLNLEPKLGGYFSAAVNFTETVTNPTMFWSLVDSTGSFPMSEAEMLRASYPATESREGTWVMGPVLPGTYRVGVEWVLSDEYFNDPPVRWRVQWYDHVASSKNATSIVVYGEQTTPAGSFDFIPASDAFISGRVFDASHNPVEGAWVGAESTTGEIAWADEATDADGNYAVRYLNPGDYTVMADGEQGSLMTSVYGFYPESATYDGATMVTVDDAKEYGGIDITLTAGQTPSQFWDLTKYQVEVPPTASTTAELLALLQARGVDIESLDDWGVIQNDNDDTLVIEDLPWKGAHDSMVDVYGYSSAKLLGSFPVRNDSVSALISTVGFGNGNHHILIVGRDSGSLRAADLTVGDSALADSGVSASPLGGLSAILLFSGATLVVASVRMRRKARLAAR